MSRTDVTGVMSEYGEVGFHSEQRTVLEMPWFCVNVLRTHRLQKHTSGECLVLLCQCLLELAVFKSLQTESAFLCCCVNVF